MVLAVVQNIYYMGAAAIIYWGSEETKNDIFIVGLLGHIWNIVDGLSGFLMLIDFLGYDHPFIMKDVISGFMNVMMLLVSSVLYVSNGPESYDGVCYLLFTVSMFCGFWDNFSDLTEIFKSSSLQSGGVALAV